MKKLTIKLFTALLSVFVMTNSAFALVLQDENSSVVINPGTSYTMENWAVDGSDILYQQTFYYRIGSGVAQNISTLALGGVNATDTNASGMADTAYLTYNGAGFDITVRYVLDGSPVFGSRQSDVAEQITISSTSGQYLEDFHFFQYSDFDLMDAGLTDTVLVMDGGSVQQTGSDGMFLNETIVSPAASHYEAGYYPSLRADIETVAGYNLADFAGPLTGDVAWAYQWDFDPFLSVQISKDKNTAPAPEPSSLALMLIGMFGLSAYRKRRAA